MQLGKNSLSVKYPQTRIFSVNYPQTRKIHANTHFSRKIHAFPYRMGLGKEINKNKLIR